MQTNLDNEKIYDARPFLKWAGGKKQLIPEIEKRLQNYSPDRGEYQSICTSTPVGLSKMGKWDYIKYGDVKPYQVRSTV